MQVKQLKSWFKNAQLLPLVRGFIGNGLLIPQCARLSNHLQHVLLYKITRGMSHIVMFQASTELQSLQCGACVIAVLKLQGLGHPSTTPCYFSYNLKRPRIVPVMKASGTWMNITKCLLAKIFAFIFFNHYACLFFPESVMYKLYNVRASIS